MDARRSLARETGCGASGRLLTRPLDGVDTISTTAPPACRWRTDRLVRSAADSASVGLLRIRMRRGNNGAGVSPSAGRQAFGGNVRRAQELKTANLWAVELDTLNWVDMLEADQTIRSKHFTR